MSEREQYFVSPDTIRDKSRNILRESSDILTFDYSSINQTLVPIVETFMNEAPYSPPPETMPIERELGVTLFMDTVNFCFQDPYTKIEYIYAKGEKKIRRSSGLFAAMKDSAVNWADFQEVAKLTVPGWRAMTQLSDSNVLYMGDERAVRIAGFAKLLSSKYASPLEFVEAMKYDVNVMLPYLAKSGYFKDEFLKRGQLTIRMLNDVLKGRKVREFTHMDNLTAMADYRIPQVLYNVGVVKLAPWLEQKLFDGEILEPDSREVRALRATVIIGAEEMSKVMDIDEGDSDTLLWTLSQKMAKEGKLTIPHMMVPTDEY